MDILKLGNLLMSAFSGVKKCRRIFPKLRRRAGGCRAGVAGVPACTSMFSEAGNRGIGFFFSKLSKSVAIFFLIFSWSGPRRHGPLKPVIGTGRCCVYSSKLDFLSRALHKGAGPGTRRGASRFVLQTNVSLRGAPLPPPFFLSRPHATD